MLSCVMRPLSVWFLFDVVQKKTMKLPVLFLFSLSSVFGTPFGVFRVSDGPVSETREMRIASSGDVVHVCNQAIISSVDVVDAHHYKQGGRVYVAVALSEGGRLKFEHASGESIGGRLAIVVSDELISVPRVMQKISTGSIQVTGLSEDAAERLVELLKKK